MPYRYPILRKTALFPAILTLCLAAACTSPEEKKRETLETTREMVAEGRAEAALRELDALSKEFPDDPEILTRIAEIHRETGDPTMAAVYFEQAYRQAPEKTPLLYDAYRMQRAADQTEAAAELLAELAETSPRTMTREMWVRLGRQRAAEGRTRPALDAFLKGLNPDSERPAAEDAVTVGELFLDAGNLPQARRWFAIAVEQDDPDALTALFGLLEIAIRGKKWADAEDIIAQLDNRFPGALDASEWADARSEIEQWRAAREEMRSTLDGSADAEDGAAEAADASRDRAGGTSGASGEASETAATAEASATAGGERADTKETSGDTRPDRTSGKTATVEDIERARAMADRPAVEAKPGGGESAGRNDRTEPGEGGSAVTFDPDIPIRPADPDLSFRVSFAEQATGADVDYSVRNRADAPRPADPLAQAFDEAAESALREELDAAAQSDRAAATGAARSSADLLEEADAALARRNYETAIRAFWRALGRENGRADIWNRLARAYLGNDQAENAETAALEAIRLDPANPDYMLDYLRVIQNTKKPAKFMAELETAHDRFPRHPEITLSLARAYERIRDNPAAARSLYRRFLEIAPNHPLNPEAENALARLSRR